MTFLKKLLKSFEDDMAVAAVAQSGELDMAKQMIEESKKEQVDRHTSENKEIMQLTVNPAEGK